MQPSSYQTKKEETIILKEMTCNNYTKHEKQNPDY
jgi:hypothetical protein